MSGIVRPRRPHGGVVARPRASRPPPQRTAPPPPRPGALQAWQDWPRDCPRYLSRIRRTAAQTGASLLVYSHNRYARALHVWVVVPDRDEIEFVACPNPRLEGAVREFRDLFEFAEDRADDSPSASPKVCGLSGHPRTPSPPCNSYALVIATVGVGTVLIWYLILIRYKCSAAA